MGKKRQIMSTLDLNNATFEDYFNRMYNIAINVVKWHNLPATIPQREIEVGLSRNGHMLFFKDDVLGYLCLPATLSGKILLYDNYSTRKVDTTSGYHNTLSTFDSVIIYNNYLRLPTLPSINLFAYRLYNIQRVIDCNIQQQKMPYIIVSNEQQRLTMENLMAKYEGNIPFIYGDTTLDLSGIKVMPTGVPYIADKLELEKRQIWNEFLTYIGINNANQDKRERLVADEVSANNENIYVSRDILLQARQQACKEINAMFGLDLWVDYNMEVIDGVDVYDPTPLDSRAVHL